MLYEAGAVLVEAVVSKQSLVKEGDKITRDESCDSIEIVFPKEITDRLVNVVKSFHPDNFEESESEGVEDSYLGLYTSGGNVVRLWWD